ncbi:MAG: hypothetical protein J7J52_03145 [Deltaproteobacteria bacterium]|nr:hypothetical protein [Deltaproteobacteria bacterium]
MLDIFSQKATEKLWKGFRNCFEFEMAEDFLQVLLSLMQIMFILNPGYRRNIDNFHGRYQFLSKDGQITVGAVIKDGHMKIKEGEIDNPHIKIIFRDGKALLNFIISPRQDILGSILHHDVETEGNLNYLYRLGYLAKQLQLMMPSP